MTKTRSLSLREIIKALTEGAQGMGIDSVRCAQLLTDAERSPSLSHAQGCPALGGYGTSDRECICRDAERSPSPAALDLIPKAKAAIQNELPEDEPDTIPDWCYETIIKTALLAVEQGTASPKGVG
jgi:hypothetical protein